MVPHSKFPCIFFSCHAWKPHQHELLAVFIKFLIIYAQKAGDEERYAKAFQVPATVAKVSEAQVRSQIEQRMKGIG